MKTEASGGVDMPPPFPHITSRCFVHVPFAMLSERLDWVIGNRLQPEIGLEGETLYATPATEFDRVASGLQKAGLACTLHAPFFDLAPGALDRHILAATRQKLRLAFGLLPVFQPRSIVCHLAFEDNKHGYQRNAWLASSTETWLELLQKAAANETIMMLENTYETNPEILQAMLSRLNSPWAQFCLDVGHVTAFARGHWQDWLPALAPWLGQLHLHDNHGGRDEHLPVGAGTIDFAGLFDYLKKNTLAPIVTLEPHSEDHLWQTLKNLDRLAYLNAIDATAP